MKRLSIILILILIAAIVVGCGDNSQSDKISKQVKPGNGERKRDNRSETLKMVKKAQHDLLGLGKMQTVALYVYQNAYGAPQSWFITVDGGKMLSLGRDDYDVADIDFKDVDDDKHDEILVTRGSGGSAGAGGLNIYKPAADKWQELFAAKNLFDLPSKRFKVNYIGNFQVGFQDSETGLKATILLVKDRYKGTGNLLPQINSWVDPISNYEVKDIDWDGLMEIVTTQRVIGISHSDTIALFKTMYKMRNQTYQTKTVSLYDDSGNLLTQMSLPVMQANNEIRISTDINKYSPLMSSAIGIGLTPELGTNLKKSKIQYHWMTTDGYFHIDETKRAKEVINSGEKLIWMPGFRETSVKSTTTIGLQAKDTQTGKILAETSLLIERDGVFYLVEPYR